MRNYGNCRSAQCTEGTANISIYGKVTTTTWKSEVSPCNQLAKKFPSITNNKIRH